MLNCPKCHNEITRDYLTQYGPNHPHLINPIGPIFFVTSFIAKRVMSDQSGIKVFKCKNCKIKLFLCPKCKNLNTFYRTTAFKTYHCNNCNTKSY